MYAQLIADFVARERLPASYIRDAGDFIVPLAGELARAVAEAPAQTLFVGINGAQGTGKSTLCQLLVELLAVHGLNAANLSIDDFYLTRAARRDLARSTHPLLISRGVPGTHELALLERTLVALAHAGADDRVSLPRFDKATDDRVPEEQWPQLGGPVHVVLLEGWFVGARPQPTAMLAQPVNRLEAEEDPDGRWRGWVNARLADFQAVFSRLDRLVMLAAPSFEQVYEWRALQEEKLRQRHGEGAGLMDREALTRFIQHFERLTRHCLATLPGQADVVLSLDAEHRLVARQDRA